MYKNILVGIALDHAPGNSQAFDVARALRQPGAKITALHVIEELPSYVVAQIPENVLLDRRPQALSELKAELGGVKDVTPAVVYGHAGRTLVEYAAEHGVDCIVIASHRPGLQDYFLGSTAQQVVRHAGCSVHVIRDQPQTFLTSD
jgi:universal stress protein F